MDGDRIDGLARLLASGLPRRTLVAGLLAGMVAPAALRPPPVAAACKQVGKSCDKNKDCCDHAECPASKCQCKDGFKNCDGKCFNLDKDEKHRDRCDNRCKASEQCCDGDCANLDTDPNHCGACGAACLTAEECIDGVCVQPPGGCPAGSSHCLSDETVNCPDHPNCRCQRSTEGRTMCAEPNTADSFCGNCSSSADCASFGADAFCMVTGESKCCGPDAQNVCRLPCPLV